MSDQMPDENDDGITRWLIIGFVACLFLGLGVMGWYYHPTDKSTPTCANIAAHCGEQQNGAAQ